MSQSPRLYVSPEALCAGALVVEGDDHHYLFRVRRLEIGAEVVLFDGQGREAAAAVENIDANQASLRVGAIRDTDQAGVRVTVLLSLIKGERMDWCVQKLVELGVHQILPVQAARSVVRLAGERAASREERWRTIARDAARQCQSAFVPEVRAIASLDEALEHVAEAPLKLLFWEQARDRSLRAALPAEAPAALAVLLGPEGSLEPQEVDRAVASGFVPVGLGPRVLRAETAAITAVAALGYAIGDLG